MHQSRYHTIMVLLFCACITPSFAANPPNVFGVPDDEIVDGANTQIQRDQELEQRLDKLLDGDFYPSDQQAFADLLRGIDASTPIETFVRAQSYNILRLAFDEQLGAALAVADEVEKLARNSGNNNALLEIEVVKAEAHLANGNTDEAVALVPTIITLLPAASNVRVRYHANHLLARVLQANNEFSDALNYLLSAQALIPETDEGGQQRRRQFLNLHLARIQANLGRWQASAETAETAITDASRSGITHHLPELYLIRAYSRQYEQGPSQEIVDAFLEAADIAEAQDHERVLMLAYNNAGAAKLLMNELDDAERYLRQGLAVAKSINNQRESSVTEFNLGYVKVLQGDHDQGIVEMLAAAEVFNSFALKREQAILLTHIARAYEIAERYQEQAATLQKQVQLTAELAEEERDQQISELQIRYEAAEKSYEIKLLEQQAQLQQQQLANQERQQQLFLVAAGSLLVVLLMFAYGYRKTRRLNQLLNEANGELHQQSLHDPLTGLYNRRAIYDRLVSDDRRLQTDQHAVILLDIDHFKNINDTHGHPVGDEVLIEFGRRLKAAIRRNDMAVRWGGEEFLLVLEHIQADQAVQVARKILKDISERAFQTDAGRLEITLSGGLTMVATDANKQPNWDATFKLVDELLYEAKAEGRNRIRYLLPDQPRRSLP
ncbi:GGDEF domain-containing protein [Pseudidiomarina salilacus]|uniref:GGDEF domain-containing protein n=1 Tax=Pseudidiomarina salilacus TaxID=3384452 RepID=UPI00398465A4